MEQLHSQMDNWKRVKSEYIETQNEWKREDFQNIWVKQELNV